MPCLLLAFCSLTACMASATSFLVAAERRQLAVLRIPRAGACMAGLSEAGCAQPPLQSGASSASFLTFPVATVLLSAGSAIASSSRRHKQARHFFGGGKDKETKKDETEEEGDKAVGEEAEEEVSEEQEAVEEEEEEELSEADKEVIAKLEEEIQELRELADEKRSAHDRLELEVNNFRKRTLQELNAARGKAAIPLIKELLPIADEFDLAKQNLKVEGEGEEAVSAKFQELFDKMLKIWKGLGVSKMESVGQDFNPELHEAVAMIPSEEYGSEIVCNEMRAGWILKTPGSEEPQVLRPALVAVSAGPGPS